MILLCLLLISIYLISRFATNNSDSQIFVQENPSASLSATLSFLSPGENDVPTLPQPSDQVITNGMRDKKEVALTFDADMTRGMKSFLVSGLVKSYDDVRVTNLLTRTQTKATFFLTGMWIEIYPDATRQMAVNPLFELANHSYSHPSFSGHCFGLPQIPQSEFASEIAKTQSLLQDIAGVANHYFRFPGGCYDAKALEIVRKEGLTVVHWDSAGSDGFNQDTQQIARNVVDRAQNGSIIVLHLGGPNAPKTAEALAIIIPTLKNQGYSFVKVSEILGNNEVKPAAFNLKEYLNKALKI